jgi:hypothetical protein
LRRTPKYIICVATGWCRSGPSEINISITEIISIPNSREIRNDWRRRRRRRCIVKDNRCCITSRFGKNNFIYT